MGYNPLIIQQLQRRSHMQSGIRSFKILEQNGSFCVYDYDLWSNTTIFKSISFDTLYSNETQEGGGLDDSILITDWSSRKFFWTGEIFLKGSRLLDIRCHLQPKIIPSHGKTSSLIQYMFESVRFIVKIDTCSQSNCNINNSLPSTIRIFWRFRVKIQRWIRYRVRSVV